MYIEQNKEEAYWFSDLHNGCVLEQRIPRKNLELLASIKRIHFNIKILVDFGSLAPAAEGTISIHRPEWMYI